MPAHTGHPDAVGGVRPTAAAPPVGAGVSDLPGVRVFRSRAFRCVLAALLWLLGTAVVAGILVQQAARPLEVGQFGIDFADYYAAAERLSAGASPYASDMLLGPVSAQGTDRYRYPPVLAQAVAPATVLGRSMASLLWLVLQAVAMWLAVWIAGSSAGGRRTLERALWTGVATTYFLPVFDTLWKGNVSAFVALAVAASLAGPLSAGTAAMGATLLKVVPGPLLAVASGRGRRSILAAAATGAVLVVPSFIAAPGAWRDYAVVLPNLLGGSADYATNVAPAAILARAGAADLGAIVRALTIAAAVSLTLAAFVLARRGRLPLATLCATVAMLLLPAAIWYHYLAVLLPLAAAAWHGATPAVRLGLAISAATITAGIAGAPLAALGALGLVATTAAGLRIPGWGAAHPR